MNRKIDTESKIKTILEKIESKLRLIANDPDVISYNYYNDSKFVGAKVMRNKKITLEQVAGDLAVLTKLVIEGFARQEVYNRKIDKMETDIAEIRQDIKEMKSTPTMQKELAELKKKK